MSERGTCVAPDCGAETPSKYHSLCKPCRERLKAATLAALPALLGAMTEERAEAEAWLAADWAPPRRWVIADDQYRPQPLDEVVDRMVKETASEWCAPHLGFVDDAQLEKWERIRLRAKLDAEPRVLSAWLVPGDAEAASAWRAHLTPLVKAALERALATFPLEHAGRQIKNAITHADGYDEDGAKGGFEEIWEGTGESGLSQDAESYLEIRHLEPIWSTVEGPGDLYFDLWMKYRSLLPDDIQAIMLAAQAADDALEGVDG